MAARPAVSDESFIRKLPFTAVRRLCLMLDPNRDWERWLEQIPSKPDQPTFTPRYSGLHARQFGADGEKLHGSSTKCIFDDWGTQNVQVKHLVSSLVKAELYAAANYINMAVLGGAEIQAPPLSGSAANSGGVLPQNYIPPGRNERPANKPLNVPEHNMNINKDDAKDTIYKTKSIAQDKSQLQGVVKKIPVENTNRVNSVRYDSSIEKTQQTGTGNALPDENFAYHGVGNVVPDENIAQFSGDAVSPGLLTQRETDMKPNFSINVQKSIPVQKPNEKSDVSQKDISKEKTNEADAGEDTFCQDDINISEQETSVVEGRHGAKSSAKSSMPEELTGLLHFPYAQLQEMTRNFNQDLHADGGNIIGKGGFGTVYIGKLTGGETVAIKALKDEFTNLEKQFETELKILFRYRHENVVPLLGYSCDGPQRCILYAYMTNGSLEDRLSCKENSHPLKIPVRISIAKGTAYGIAYLNKYGLVHCDIKSANILLDENFVPRVGDFATTRQLSSTDRSVIAAVSTVIGTSAYLPPEAMECEISAKLDAYSYGVVILELLTGLPAFDATREEHGLKTHVEEADDITDLVDLKAGTWAETLVMSLYNVALRCLQYRRKQRATVADIIPDLEVL